MSELVEGGDCRIYELTIGARAFASNVVYGWHAPALRPDGDPSAATHSSTARTVAHVEMIAATHFLRDISNVMSV